jgi:hypothetical protein
MDEVQTPDYRTCIVYCQFNGDDVNKPGSHFCWVKSGTKRNKKVKYAVPKIVPPQMSVPSRLLTPGRIWMSIFMRALNETLCDDLQFDSH